MRKVVYKQFGDESVLELTQQPIPTLANDQVLVQVKAVSINPLDWKVYRGEMKLLSGTKFPKAVGIDFAGVVEQAGSRTTRYQAGDEVMGILDVFKGGALADYVVVKEADLAPKPSAISFAEAAALPLTGLSALQIIDKLAAVKANQDVLINGATGGIGVFAVQLAKKRGARVTAVVGATGGAEAKKWGADTVLDYTKQDVQRLHQRFDVVIDLSTKLSFTAAKKLLKSRAVFVTTLASPLTMLRAFLNNLVSRRKLKVLIVKPSSEGLRTLASLAGQELQVVLAKTYPLNEVRQVYREASQGKTIGKSVIVLD